MPLIPGSAIGQTSSTSRSCLIRHRMHEPAAMGPRAHTPRDGTSAPRSLWPETSVDVRQGTRQGKTEGNGDRVSKMKYKSFCSTGSHSKSAQNGAQQASLSVTSPRQIATGCLGHANILHEELVILSARGCCSPPMPPSTRQSATSPRPCSPPATKATATACSCC